MDAYNIANFFVPPDFQDIVVEKFVEYNANAKKCDSLMSEVWTQKINPPSSARSYTTLELLIVVAEILQADVFSKIS